MPPALRLHLLGTGNAPGLPRAGCRCTFCEAARSGRGPGRGHPQYLIEADGTTVALEAGDFELASLVARHDIGELLLSHFDDDHCWGLGKLRWGVGEALRMHCPPVAAEMVRRGSHGRGLDFRAAEAFASFPLGPLEVTPLPLAHGKPCFGWAVRHQNALMAYLSDTCGLPGETRSWLEREHPELVLVDAGEVPGHRHGAHHSIPEAIELLASLAPGQGRLIHLGCEGLRWLAGHRPELPDGVAVAVDGEVIELPG